MFDRLPTARRRPWRSATLLGIAMLTLAACGGREVILPGERFAIDIPLAATRDGGQGVTSDPSAADGPAAISLPGATRHAAWAQRGFDARNRVPHAALSGGLAPVWAADIGPGNSRRNVITADPVAADGRVFTMDSRAGVVASSITDGATIWRADLQPEFDRGGDVSGGGLAVSGGRLFATTGFGELVALDAASGAVIWRQRLDAGIGAPTLADGRVYVVSRNNQGWGVDAESGRLELQVRSTRSEALLSAGAAPASGDGLVLFPFGSGEISGVSAGTGTTRWVTAVTGGRAGSAYANINDINSDPVLAGGRVFAGNQSGRVVAIDPSAGTRLWSYDEGAYSPILATGSDVFFVSDRNELIRLSAATGERVWGTPLPLFVNTRERRRRAVFTHYGPILAGGQLVVASGDNQIRLFSPESGALVGSVALRSGAAAHPIVVNETLLVVTQDGRLQAFR